MAPKTTVFHRPWVVSVGSTVVVPPILHAPAYRKRVSFSLNFSCVCVPSLSWQILELSQYKMARNKDVFCTVEEWADDRGGHVLIKNAYIYIFV